jgi:hypothetical protein
MVARTERVRPRLVRLAVTIHEGPDLFRRRKSRDEGDRTPPGEVFASLRGLILNLDPAEAGIEPSAAYPRVWAALMETGYPNGVAALVALADGTTSLYTSSGFGIIGGGGHASVVAANQAFLSTVETHLDQLPATEDMATPAEGWVTLRALTYAGRRAAGALEDDLGDGRHGLSPVFHAGHDVITQLRLIHEASGT